MAGTPRAFGSEAERRGAFRKGRSRTFFLAAMLLTAACVADTAPPHNTATAAPKAAPIPSATAAPVPAALTATVSTVRADGAEKFSGMERAQVARLLGRPDFVRRDAPAEIWQYRAGGCILDLFLYEERGGMRVAHAELRGRAAGGSCGEAVAARTASPPKL